MDNDVFPYLCVIMRRLFALVLFILFCVPSFAQSKAVSGTVADKAGAPIPYASVVLTRDGAIVTGAMTDESGQFIVKAGTGKYTLTVEFIGYDRVSRQVEVLSSRLDMGIIILEESVQSLGAAVVSTRQDAKKSSVEHTTINADANISGSKGSVLDILRSAPSVSVASDKGITVRGKSNILVLIDGVPTTVTDLESLPAANVKSVEVITNPDAVYDSEGTGGIINVVSKKQNASGISGIAGASYGFSHFANGNFAMACNSPKISWRLNGNARYEDDLIDGSLFRRFVSTGSSISQQIHSAKTTFNSNIGVGVTCRPDKKNTLSADLKLLLPRYNTRQDFSNTYQTGGTMNLEKRYSDVTWNRENLDASASWRHIMQPDFSEFTLGGNVSKIWGHRPSFYYLEGDQVGKSESGGSPFISSLSGDFKLRYSPGTLEFGAKMTFRMNSQYSGFFIRNGEEWIPSPELSADLNHHEYVPALYAMFSSKEAGRFSYKTGIRTEYSIVKLHSVKESIDRTKGDLFLAPYLSGTFRISQGQSVSLAYGRRIGRPAYPQLNPYMSMIDARTFEQGNLDLDPERSDNLDLSYSGKAGCLSVFADVYLSHTSGYVTQVSSLTDGNVLLMTYINCTSDTKSGIDLSLKISPVRWFDASLSANTFHTETRGDFENIDTGNRGWSNSSNILLNFLPYEKTDIQLQYFLSSPQYYPQFTTAFRHYMNIGVRQSLCKGALTLSATATDVCGTDKWEIHSSNRIFTLDNTSFRKSRMIWLGISYNFNSFKQPKLQKKQEENRTRLNLGL